LQRACRHHFGAGAVGLGLRSADDGGAGAVLFALHHDSSPRSSAMGGAGRTAGRHLDPVFHVLDARAILDAVLDGMLGAAVGHAALQSDLAVLHVDFHVPDVQAAVAQVLAHVLAHPLVRAYVASGIDARAAAMGHAVA